jgi:hypothetical protein
MSEERRKARLLLRAAAVLFAVCLLSGFIPVRAGVSYDPTMVVNCGSFFISTDWGGDEGCEGAFFDRILWAAGAILLAVLLVVVAAISSAVDRE